MEKLLSCIVFVFCRNIDEKSEKFQHAGLRNCIVGTAVLQGVIIRSNVFSLSLSLFLCFLSTRPIQNLSFTPDLMKVTIPGPSYEKSKTNF